MYLLILTSVTILVLFIAIRLVGIFKMNERIINILLSYLERHENTPGELIRSNLLFVPYRKMIWSFKPLDMEKWLDKDVIDKLNS